MNLIREILETHCSSLVMNKPDGSQDAHVEDRWPSLSGAVDFTKSGRLSTLQYKPSNSNPGLQSAGIHNRSSTSGPTNHTVFRPKSFSLLVLLNIASARTASRRFGSALRLGAWNEGGAFCYLWIVSKRYRFPHLDMLSTSLIYSGDGLFRGEIKDPHT